MTLEALLAAIRTAIVTGDMSPVEAQLTTILEQSDRYEAIRATVTDAKFEKYMDALTESLGAVLNPETPEDFEALMKILVKGYATYQSVR